MPVAPKPPATDAGTEEITESIPEPLPRIAVPDTDAFSIPGEATHWRAYRVMGQRREQLAFAEGGADAYKEWPLVDVERGELLFSLEEVRRRWGTGDFRIHWITRYQNRALLCGNPVDVTIMPEAQVHRAPAPVTRAESQMASVAPAGVGPASDGFQFFQGFMGIFMQSVAVLESRAAQQIAMDRERAAQNHEQQITRDRAVYEVHQRSIEQQMENQRRESKDSRAALLAVIERQNAQIERLMTILDPAESEGEEEEQSGAVLEGEHVPAPAPAPAPIVEATAEPVSNEPDILGKIADAGNAVGNAFEKLGTALQGVDAVANTVKGMMPRPDGSAVPAPAS